MIKRTTKNLFIAALALMSMHVVSCASIKASADLANEKEGGQSGYDQSANLGFNLGLGWVLGTNSGAAKVSRPGDGSYGTEDSVWDPFDRPFEAQPAAGGSFAVSPSIEFVQKGSKAFGEKSRENYLEGVVDAQYRYMLSNGGTVYGGLGPFIAYGIGGKSGAGSNEVATFGGSDGYKRFDAGLNLAAGYIFASSLQFELSYDLGLVDKSPDPSDYTSKSRNFAFSVGYSVDKIVGAFKRH